MGRSVCWLALLVACGGRTTLGEVIRVEQGDAAAEPDSSTPTPTPAPHRVGCFPGAVALTPNVVCSVSPSRGDAKECTARLSCDEGTVIEMHCVDGVCQCTNVDRDTCTCRAPDMSDPCGKNNCCWD
jgi:hypothetical protein